MTHTFRTNLPPLPPRMRGLPIDHRGFPVPWFVAFINGEPDFRVIGEGKVARAWNGKVCWLCGEKLGRFSSFVIGPMCVFNRTSAEPPSHLDCARFAAAACPFLVKPRMSRNESDYDAATGLPPGAVLPAGTMLRRNPGACAIWNTRNPHAFRANGGVLFNIGAPNTVEWYAEGRTATRAEVLESIRTGLPLLLEACEQDADPRAARVELMARAIQAAKTLPPGEGEIDLRAVAMEGAA